MIDWNVVISAVIGLVTGGGVSWLFRIREEKAGSKADVVDNSTEAMNKMLELINTQQERFNKIIADKDASIADRDILIAQYQKTLEELNAKINDDLNVQIRELKLKVAENERKLAGMQKTIENEIKERKFAEENVCFVSDCELRRPKRGTYKKETA